MKRIAVGLTWTFLLMWAGNYVALLAGIPAVVTASIALAAGAFIAIDPVRQIWPKAQARPINDTTRTDQIDWRPSGAILRGPTR